MRRLTLGIAIAAFTCCALGAGLLMRGGRLVSVVKDLTREPDVEAATWPDERAKLTPPAIAFPAGFGRHRIYLDPGHGAQSNTGNSSAFCEAEQDFTLRVGSQLAAALAQTGHFETRLSRHRGQLVPYAERVAETQHWPAEAFISIHSDVRGQAEKWSPRPDLQCSRNEQAPGFAVLYSDEGSLRERRRQLAEAVARRMAETGFLIYDGDEYHQLYDPDPHQPGVFIDRHQPTKRIFVLRRPVMPSIIIETHNAWDPREAARWRESRTIDALSGALIAALVDVLGSSAVPPKRETPPE